MVCWQSQANCTSLLRKSPNGHQSLNPWHTAMTNKKSVKKKTAQLGMPPGTAANRLRKMLLFSMANELQKTKCFHCGIEITNIDDFSIEHKIPWLDSGTPIELFFDLNNIAFSHLSCNTSTARKWNKGIFTIPNHGTLARYKDARFKCRCRKCKNENNKWLREYKARRKSGE